MNLYYLVFSDTAKFALIGRELATNGQFVTTFNFWNPDFFSIYGILPVYPYLLSIFFKLFGINDLSILITSFLFFFLTALFIYLFTSKLFNRFTGFLASFVFLFSSQMIEFVKSGASETLFIFEIILGVYLISLKNKLADFGTIFVLILLYFTKPQAFIYILGLLIFYFLVNFNFKKAIVFSILSIIGYILIDLTFFTWLNGKYFTYSILARGVNATVNHLPNVPVSDSLRGNVVDFSLIVIIKKVFYNLYNFYKAIPEIMNPYLFGLFVIGMFNWSKSKLQNSFKISSLFMVLLNFFITALTIPFYRYLHPVVLFIYIVAVGTLVQLFEKNRFKTLITTLLILFFAVGQALGIIFLDSRFEKKLKNVDKPPIYVEMSHKLKEITDKDMIIATNLDTWGSWYGERKTIWFPLSPEMILPHKDKIDAIYLTSYRMDDQNYYMGERWREIFNNPRGQIILPDYKFVGEYEFRAEDNYEKENGRGVLLIKNSSFD